MPMRSTNPMNGEVLREYPELTDAELEAKLARAEKAFYAWRETSFEERAILMRKLAGYLRTQSHALSTLMALEMGKTLKAGVAELEKCALTCEFYADQTATILGHESTTLGVTESYVQFDPLGTVLAVMPWNFPFWQVYRFAIPALMAGNVGVLKHASNVPQCAEAIEESFRACGFPEDVFQNLLIGSARVEAVVRDARIKAVTLTGSEYAGSMVAKAAGEELKKTVLELGGSDPFIVLEDADIDAAAAAAVTARLQGNVGQSCIAAKRFIVHASVAEAFTEKFAQGFARLRLGNPLEEGVDVGPLASKQMREEIDAQVQNSLSKGARLVCGGKRVDEVSNLYEPTILTDVKKGMPVYDEEVFGPVAAIITVSDEEEAIRIANDTPYGLGASLFTKDLARAKRLVTKIEAGAVFVNSPVKSDPRTPFGGIKKSGYGRELSHYGIKEFVNIKTVSIK
ncbi:NAD-dependent succinate-semialdehyde dehydrogenase [Patescibacteria group bacterium]|nr:NAD-dependent succinate-semialdehyde dehydrogenase [Patescibacteria group bacterium]